MITLDTIAAVDAAVGEALRKARQKAPVAGLLLALKHMGSINQEGLIKCDTDQVYGLPDDVVRDHPDHISLTIQGSLSTMAVDDEWVGIKLAFGGRLCALSIPLDAISLLYIPSLQYRLEPVRETAPSHTPTPGGNVVSLFPDKIS